MNNIIFYHKSFSYLFAQGRWELPSRAQRGVTAEAGQKNSLFLQLLPDRIHLLASLGNIAVEIAAVVGKKATRATVKDSKGVHKRSFFQGNGGFVKEPCQAWPSLLRGRLVFPDEAPASHST